MITFLLLVLVAFALAGVGFAATGMGYLIAAGAVVFAAALVFGGYRAAHRRRVAR